MDWAKHRRKKAAAKVHLCLNLESFLPRFIVFDAAKHSDCVKAYELCSGLTAGEIVVFDKAYVDFKHLNDLDKRGVFWVTRAKGKWQIWTALLVYILLRFLAHVSQWPHSFNRLFTFLRGILWSRFNLFNILKAYGTASEHKRMRAAPEQAYLQGLAP